MHFIQAPSHARQALFNVVASCSYQQSCSTTMPIAYNTPTAPGYIGQLVAGGQVVSYQNSSLEGRLPRQP